MKRCVTLSTFVLLLSLCAKEVFSQQSENAALSHRLSSGGKILTNDEKLMSLCKLWGFLKYHHPVVAKGKIDWDNQLIDYIGKIEEVPTKEKLSEVYLQWVESLGKLKVYKGKDKAEKTFDKNFDTAWFHSAYFTKELSGKLSSIYKNRHRGKNFYARKPFFQTIFPNEKAYPGMDFPDPSFRLLTLFRYWNIINYYFPSKYLIGEDWTLVLQRMIPLFQDAPNPIDFHAAVLQLVSSINDSHAHYFNQYIFAFLGKKLLPCSIKIVGDRAVVTHILNDSLGKRDDLKIGDAISKFDGIPTMDVIRTNWKYIPASNYQTKLRNAPLMLSYGKADSVEIEFERDGVKKTKVIHRYSNYALVPKRSTEVSYPKTDLYKWINENIGYINLRNLKRKEAKKAFAKFKGTEGIIIDLREYPKTGGYTTVSKKIHTSRVRFMKQMYPAVANPGKYRFVNALFGLDKTGRRRTKNYKGQVVLLINENTQSMGEMVAMMLKSEAKVKTVGGQTAGANGSATSIVLPGNFKTAFSGVGVFFPDGTEAQRKGVIPDFPVNPTIEGIRQGKDELLEKAIEVIHILSGSKQDIK